MALGVVCACVCVSTFSVAMRHPGGRRRPSSRQRYQEATQATDPEEEVRALLHGGAVEHRGAHLISDLGRVPDEVTHPPQQVEQHGKVTPTFAGSTATGPRALKASIRATVSPVSPAPARASMPPVMATPVTRFTMELIAAGGIL